MSKIASPAVTTETAQFWAKANEGQFTVPQCKACGKFHWYPRAYCPFCDSDKVELKPAVETGSLKIVTTAEDYHVLVDSREILHRIAREATLPGIPQGKHMVRFVHATLGTQEKEVILSAGDIESVTFDLGDTDKK